MPVEHRHRKAMRDEGYIKTETGEEDVGIWETSTLTRRVAFNGERVTSLSALRAGEPRLETRVE